MLAISWRPSLSNIGLKFGAINFHKLPNSISLGYVNRGPPWTDSKVKPVCAVTRPTPSCNAIIPFGTYSETRSFTIICRPRNWRRYCTVEPTPIEPSEVTLPLRVHRFHWRIFSTLLKNFQTSSTGRLMIMLFSILILVMPLLLNRQKRVTDSNLCLFRGSHIWMKQIGRFRR